MIDSDELLREALEYVDLENKSDVCADLRNEDYPFDKQVQIILAREILLLRPELNVEKNPDVLYVVENGKNNFTLPSKSLSDILRENKPYDDSQVWTYSLGEGKLLKRIYKGTGTKWERSR